MRLLANRSRSSPSVEPGRLRLVCRSGGAGARFGGRSAAAQAVGRARDTGSAAWDLGSARTSAARGSVRSSIELRAQAGRRPRAPAAVRSPRLLDPHAYVGRTGDRVAQRVELPDGHRDGAPNSMRCGSSSEFGGAPVDVGRDDADAFLDVGRRQEGESVRTADNDDLFRACGAGVVEALEQDCRRAAPCRRRPDSSTPSRNSRIGQGARACR